MHSLLSTIWILLLRTGEGTGRALLAAGRTYAEAATHSHKQHRKRKNIEYTMQRTLLRSVKSFSPSARWCSGGVWDAARECHLERIGEGKGAVILKMNRPARKNAFGRVMLQEFGECLDACTESASIRSVVLVSTVSGVFSAGADLKERKEMSQDEASTFVTKLRSTFSALEELRCPTISVIDGVALGGGLELALSTDLRVCTDKSKLGVPETGLAIIPGAGGTQRLPRAVGIPRAKEMIFTADPVCMGVLQCENCGFP